MPALKSILEAVTIIALPLCQILAINMIGWTETTFVVYSVIEACFVYQFYQNMYKYPMVCAFGAIISCILSLNILLFTPYPLKQKVDGVMDYFEAKLIAFFILGICAAFAGCMQDYYKLKEAKYIH